YRSSNTILAAANTLIANNSHVFEKKLWSELGRGDPIRVIVTPNEDAEVERIAVEILSQCMQGRSFKDFAVLYRGNHQARLLEIKLQSHQIPYTLTGGTSFFARSEIKDLMAYLKLLINPDDDNSFLRCINLPRRGIGPAILEGLGLYAGKAKVSLFEACGHLGLGEHLNENQRKKLAEFNEWMTNAMRQLDNGEGVRIVRELIDDIGYEAWLQSNANTPTAAEKAMGNVHALVASIEKSMKKTEEEGGEPDLKEAINKLILRDLLEQQEEEE